VRWKIAAIIVFVGTSAILGACLAVAALNVMVRREGANVVEKLPAVLMMANLQAVARSVLTWVNSGNPAPILSSSTGEIERLNPDGFPVTAGEFAMRPGSRLLFSAMVLLTLKFRGGRIRGRASHCLLQNDCARM
jgi:hypothetical protein